MENTEARLVGGRLKLEIGNLVRVRYPHDKFFGGEVFLGFVTETQEKNMFDRMWCITTHSEHIINQFRDEIEVLNK